MSEQAQEIALLVRTREQAGSLFQLTRVLADHGVNIAHVDIFERDAERAVARLPRARALVLAGALMGGEITAAVHELRSKGILVISLNMAGSVPEAADLVVSDPVQAGVMAVMAVADTARFDIARQEGRRY